LLCLLTCRRSRTQPLFDITDAGSTKNLEQHRKDLQETNEEIIDPLGFNDGGLHVRLSPKSENKENNKNFLDAFETL
jgi:hypothetical protein